MTAPDVCPCGNTLDSGEGWDGLCGTCADRLLGLCECEDVRHENDALFHRGLGTEVLHLPAGIFMVCAACIRAAHDVSGSVL